MFIYISISPKEHQKALIDVATAPEPPVSIKKKRRGRPPSTPEIPKIDHVDSIPAEFSEPEDPGPAETSTQRQWKREDAIKAAAEPTEAAPFPPIQPKTTFDILSNYWNNILSPAQRQQGTVYLYRLSPKMLLVAGRGGRLVNANCEKFNEEDGPITRDLIRSRRRMGTYLLRLNQRVVKPSCEISNAEVEISGDITDANDMPILDVKNLDLGAEGNRDYIRLLRSRGILKADEEEQEGAGEMAAQEVLGDITTKLLNDRLTERQQPQQQQQQQPAAVDAGVGKELVGLLREQINQNRPAAEQGTVLDMVECLTKLQKANAPPPVDMSGFYESQNRYTALVERMMLKDVERAEADAKKAREEADAYKASLPKPLTVDEQFDQLERAAQRYERITGKKRRRDEDDEEKPPETMGAAGWAGTILGAAPVILQMWDRLNYSLAVMKGVPPPTIAAQPNPQPNGNGSGQTDKVVPINGQQQSDSEEDQGPTEAEQMEQAMLTTLGALLPPMIKFFQDKKSGKDFAVFVVENFNADSLMMVKGFGKQKILNALSGIPEVWKIISPRTQDFHKFIDEFLAYQAVPVQ